jgi:hypothetical protein
MEVVFWTVKVCQSDLHLDAVREPLSCEAAAEVSRLLNRFLGPNQRAELVKVAASAEFFGNHQGAG